MEMIKNFVTAISNVDEFSTEPVSAEVETKTKITEEQEQMFFNTVSKVIDTAVTSVPRQYVDVLTLQLEKRGYLFKESGLDIVYDGVKIMLKFIVSLLYHEMSKDASEISEEIILNKLKDIMKDIPNTAENTEEQYGNASTSAIASTSEQTTTQAAENTEEQSCNASTSAAETTAEKNVPSGEFKMEYFENVYGLSKEVCTRNAEELKVLSQSNSFKEFDKLARGKMPLSFERNNKIVNIICDGMSIFMIFKNKDGKFQVIGTENLETVKSLIKVATAVA